ncbi:MAG: CHAP domain-containing protein [Streptococcaceae bacterium]|jgi:peptidoglycan hydrolase CwlO-like protein|nr:CHAP domain-containing protein [Streptococcaceae bacterium]
MSIKKKALAGLLLSTVTLSTLAPITPLTHTKIAYANTTDDQIAAAEATIANAQASSAETQAALNTLQASVDAANEKVNQLLAESTATSAQIKELKVTIEQRSETLKTQARNAQTSGSVTNYINTIINSKSLTDVVQRISAMTQMVRASNNMLKQQKKDQAALQEKLAQNTKAYGEAKELQDQLEIQKHDLEAAKIAYSATIASTQEEKDQLLAKKAEEIAKAEAAAAAQAAAEKAAAEAAAARAAQQQQSASTTTSNSTASNSTSDSSSSVYHSIIPVSYSSNNPFPAGQCTWGVYEILNGNMPIFQGNAGDWAVNANSSTPVAGAIMVFSPAAAGNEWGHVAVVDSVNPDGTVNIRESNYNEQKYITSRSNVSTAGCLFIIL